MKVERKVPVSEEGMEDFFNSLSGKPCPCGLAVNAPFVESHMSFPLSSEGFAMLSFMIQEETADKAKILSSQHCPQNLIEASWAAKDRLDALWNRPPPPMARSLIARVARKQLFPHSGEGGQEHENRAGDKLAQISEIVDMMDGIPQGSAFLDLCGGPGAWSQHLLGKKDLALKGFGFTLKAASGGSDDWKAQEKDEWYEDLYEHPDWTALWGLDGTGDLLKSGNVEHCVKGLANEHVLLVVADGGFSDDAIPPNLLELYFYRLFLAELLTAASCLSPGGNFVCKLYSTFSDATAALLFLTTQLFESVRVVKPISSKCTGPERYLVGTNFLDDSKTSAICAALARSHALGAGASPLSMPLLTPTVPVASLLQDETFSAGLKQMVTAMCERQTKALNAVVDRADFLEDVAMASAVCTDPWARREPRGISMVVPEIVDKYVEIPCPFCTKTYKQQDRLNQHLEKKHPNEANGQCPLNDLPTPSRARAGNSQGKGKGKGKCKGKGKGTSKEQGQRS
jgi:cap1 methyltransferase